jgi:hypothetical protein
MCQRDEKKERKICAVSDRGGRERERRRKWERVKGIEE